MRSLTKLSLGTSVVFFAGLGLTVWLNLLPDATWRATLLMPALVVAWQSLGTLIVCACVNSSSPVVVEMSMQSCRWMGTVLVTGMLAVAAVSSTVGAIMLASGVDGGRALLVFSLWTGAFFFVLTCAWGAALRWLLPQIKVCRAVDEEPPLCGAPAAPQYGSSARRTPLEIVSVQV